MSDSARSLRDAMRALLVAHGALEEARRPCGASVSMPHAHALLELRATPLRVTQLAARLNIDRTNVSRLCKRMESSGDLERNPDPGDARAILLMLTEQGRALADRVDASSAAHFERVQGQLEDSSAVLQALRALERALLQTASLWVVGMAALLLACQPSAPVVSVPASTTSSPYEELAKIDGRAPVPLRPMMAWHQKQNMMDHLVVIQEITTALARQDWKGVEVASARIEPSPGTHQMCAHMGAGAPGFTALATTFHERAAKIAPAARSRDIQAVLEATSETLQACTSCHQSFRQEIVSDADWSTRTGM